ncbi:hypothetical protein ACVW00_003819 [Marmoricola sp. URHA0025 HA25]
MQTRQCRDDKTVVIATALGIFAISLGVGSTLLWAIRSVLDLSEDGTSPEFMLLVAVSAVATVVYLVRAGRR